MFDHADTGTGWSNDRRVVFRKGVHEIQRHGSGLIFEAVIEERLSATGLFGRKNQFDAELLEEARHILKRGCIELIAKTGDK